MTAIIHVAPAGSDRASGTESEPLRTINQAARRACPGDTVLVHAGEYREWVRPRRGGLSDDRRITYAAAPGEHVVIKGSEQWTQWSPQGAGVWRAEIPRAVFGDFNPFEHEVGGDWVEYPSADAPRMHLGDVYLDGRSLYEAASREAVAAPPRRTADIDRWTGATVQIADPAWTQRVWHAQVGELVTTIWANFGEEDPAEHLVEIAVRRSVFYPEEHHVNYITVRGFEMAHAATPWAPPTADQPGLLGPNWAKGWIMEDNVIHDAKCAGISLGKERSTGHNLATLRGDKPGYQYQLESVFTARQIGWDREHIGSHVVRRNVIFNCGQAGIVGHLGAVFSRIEDNHIHHIATKREFYGYEIGGIKLHAAIDVVIAHNRFHECTLGTWLDWQTQGTRITRNIYYSNNRDLFVEVSHGPYLVDHNVFASPAALEIMSQGGAFVHNLIAGTVRLEQVLDRATPYHLPHSTQVAGYATILGGDDRYIGNLFLGGNAGAAYAPGSDGYRVAYAGTSGYDAYPASWDEYMASVEALEGDHQRFVTQRLPAYIRHNAYVGAARPFVGEQEPLELGDAAVSLTVSDAGAEVYLEVNLPVGIAALRIPAVSGHDLGVARNPDAEYEEPDGRPAVLDTDLVGESKVPGGSYPPGPLVQLPAGQVSIRVW